MSIKIVDKLSCAPKPKVPIVLVSRLQIGVNISGARYFYEGDFNNADYLKSIQTITRIGRIIEGTKEVDIIIVDGCLFLGCWNDGVLESNL